MEGNKMEGERMEIKFVLFVPLYKGKKIRREYDSAAKAIKAFRNRVANYPWHTCHLNVVDVYDNCDNVVSYTPYIRNTATYGYVDPVFKIGTAISAILGA